jgi:hypothetical protein
MFVGG